MPILRNHRNALGSIAAMLLVLLIAPFAACAQTPQPITERARLFYLVANSIQSLGTFGWRETDAADQTANIRSALKSLNAPANLVQLANQLSEELQKPADKRGEHTHDLVKQFNSAWGTWFRDLDDEATTYGSLGLVTEMCLDHYMLKSGGAYTAPGELKSAIQDSREVARTAARLCAADSTCPADVSEDYVQIALAMHDPESRLEAIMPYIKDLDRWFIQHSANSATADADSK